MDGSPQLVIVLSMWIIKSVFSTCFWAIIIIFAIKLKNWWNMETLIKPTYRKPGPDDFFKKLQKEVQEKVLGDKRIQRRNVIKTFFLLALYFSCYAGILLFGNHTPLLFLFYIFLGF